MQVNKYFDEQLQETLFSTTLENGLSVYAIPKEGYSTKYAIFATHYGSNDSVFVLPDSGETLEVPDGIAHFLEHKMFEEEWGSIFTRFSELGVSANAFTNYTTTAYIFSGTDNFEEALETLIDFVQRPYFTSENVEKEKGIIEQEIRMYLDHPGWRVQSNLLTGLYSKHPVRTDIAGSVESIRKITKDLLYKCYNTFYHPSNMNLFVIGDIDPNKVLRQVTDNQARKNYGQQQGISRIYPDESPKINQMVSTEELAVAIPLFMMGFKDLRVGQRGLPLLKKEITTNLVCHLILGKSSKLFNQLYQDGLITDEFGATYNGQVDYGYTAMGCATPYPDRLYEALKVGIDEAGRNGIDRKNFERVRSKFMGLYVASYNSLSLVANRYISHLIKGIDFFDYAQVLNSITLDEVNQRLREHFALDNHAASVVIGKGQN